MVFHLLLLLASAVIFGAGLICGLILGWGIGGRGKQNGTPDRKVALAEKDEAVGGARLREALEPYEGATLEEKFASFLKRRSQGSGTGV